MCCTLFHPLFHRVSSLLSSFWTSISFFSFMWAPPSTLCTSSGASFCPLSPHYPHNLHFSLFLKSFIFFFIPSPLFPVFFSMLNGSFSLSDLQHLTVRLFKTIPNSFITGPTGQCWFKPHLSSFLSISLSFSLSFYMLLNCVSDIMHAHAHDLLHNWAHVLMVMHGCDLSLKLSRRLPLGLIQAIILLVKGTEGRVF